MKFELIVFDRSSIQEIPSGWRPVDWLQVDVRKYDDIRRVGADGQMIGHGKGLIFSFDANFPDGTLMLTHLRGAVDHLGLDKTKWPEYEVRINRVLLEEFYKGMAIGLDQEVREAIKLLKKARGNKPSKKEATIRKLLTASLPENQPWLNRPGMVNGKYASK